MAPQYKSRSDIDEIFGLPSGAILSSDRAYRYLLWRRVSPGKEVLTVVGLNPSTADESTNDPTVRRCIGFARSWGYSVLCVVNLFAFRATDPGALNAAAEPIGSENDFWLGQASRAASLTLAAWGNLGLLHGRNQTARPLLVRPKCLGLTKLGQPRHPLYVPADQLPFDYVSLP